MTDLNVTILKVLRGDFHADPDHALEFRHVEGAAAILIIARKDLLGRGAEACRLEPCLNFVGNLLIDLTPCSL